MAQEKTYQLAELTGFIRRVFALNLPGAVWVRAELAQANVSRGHCWLSLVEKDAEGDAVIAQLEGVVWAARLQQLRMAHGKRTVDGLLQQGMAVRLRVATSFHDRYGFRLVVEDIDPEYTVGVLELRKRKTLESLAAEGLLKRNGSLPFPLLPRRIALISGQTAAGLADFRAQLANNPYGYCFTEHLFPAAVQGERTAHEIAARLRQIARRKASYDLVVIVRGGGGRTDLAAFDEEALGRAVAECPLPVVVGIGHETDDSVLDRVAARSLKTPTAAAVFLIESLVQAESRVLGIGRELSYQARQALAAEKPRLERYAVETRQSARSALAAREEQLQVIEASLLRARTDALRRAEERVDHLADLLAALRPETTLARGYALVSQEGRLITAPENLRAGEVELRLKDGRTTLRKTDI